MDMRRLTTLPPAIALAIGLFLAVFGAREAEAQPYEAVVLTNNSLIVIDTANPGAGGAPVAVTGLNVGDTLVGIDLRPINGYLYGLGHNSGAGTLQLYNVSSRTGVATPIGATGTFVAADGTTPVPMTGTGFGVDFNPVADRLRIVNDAGQNFRINPNTGAFIDGDLGGSPGSVPGLNMDGTIGGAAVAADAAAYTNNLVGVGSTTLYTLSAAADTLYIQNPPNGGTATLPIVVTVNGSPLDFTAANGFDIAPNAFFSLTENGPSGGNGHAVLTVGGTTSLYTIHLTNGTASPVGPIGTGAISIQGFALNAVRIPAECGVPAVVIVEPNQLQPVRTGSCGASGSEAPAAISGLVPGETLVAIDFRPQTGQLYGLGVNPAVGTGSATLYLLDPSTSAATIVGAASGVANGSGTPIELGGATSFGFDFNPTVDRIRVVTNNGLNFRLNPNDGAVVGGALDPGINGLGSTGLVGAAYTNSFGQSLTGGTTTLYTLDPGSDRLFIQNPANAGTQTAGIPVTLGGSPLDFGAVAGFDIAPAIRVGTSNAPATGVAFAVLGQAPIPNMGGNAAALYEIDLATGAARRVGMYWVNLVWTGLAVGDGPRNPTTLAVASSAPTAVIGQPVTLTATVAPPIPPGISASPHHATGTVAFTVAGTPIAGCGAQPIIGLTATCLTTFLALGQVQITATYGGDSIHRGSTSTALIETILNTTSTTSLTVTPNPSWVGQVVTLRATVIPAAAGGSVTFRVDGNFLDRMALSGGTASFPVNNLTEGVHQFQVSYHGTADVAPSEAEPVTVMVTAAGPLTQHFAEGATGFMQTDVGIFNANTLSPAAVNVKLLPEAGDPVNLEFTLDPLGRRSVDVNALVRERGVPDQGFSILVESTQPVAATRQMTWGRPVYGSTLESGLPTTSPTWYFAEGATNIMSLYYMVENPNATPANVVLTHLLEGGAAPVTHTDVVPPFTRRTYDVNAVPGLASAALSTVVSANVPIVVERAMYLNTTNRLWEGGAAGGGAAAPSHFWSFGEGATGFFHTYLCLGNPDDSPSNVDVTYQLSSGETVMRRYNVAGKSRLTIDVNGEDPKLAAAEFGMMMFSSMPIVAERAMWWGGLPWSEGSVSIGSAAAGKVWAIGEGAEGGPTGESTFVQVSNRMLSPGRVRFTVGYDDGTQEQREYELVGSARLTVRIGVDFPNAVGRKFSVLVESLIASDLAQITVEYARYQSPVSFGDGGGAALATRIR
jgi:hypothetical protein